MFDYRLIENLTKLNLKIFIVGDSLNIKKVNNLGYVNRKKINILQSRSKYSLCSRENIYSLFIIECITNHVKIFINKDQIKQVKILKKFFNTYKRSKINLVKKF